MCLGRVLPPRNLPFVHFDPRVLAELRVQLEAREEWEQREEKTQVEQAQDMEHELYEETLLEQAKAREFMEETSQERELELREARQPIVFVFFRYFFPYFRGPARGGGILYFSSNFRDSGVFGLL